MSRRILRRFANANTPMRWCAETFRVFWCLRRRYCLARVPPQIPERRTIPLFSGRLEEATMVVARPAG